MRRLAVLLSLVLVLAACGGVKAGTPTVTGEFGQAPKIDTEGLKPTGQTEVKVLHDGTGPALNNGDFLLFHAVAQDWRPGKVILNTYEQGAQGIKGQLLGAGQLQVGWDEAPAGKKVGSRVLIVVPASEFLKLQGESGEGHEEDAAIYVIDVLGAIAGNRLKASGKTVAQNDGKLPTVAEAGGTPKVTVPKGAAPPNELVSKVVIEGPGAPLKKGQVLVAHYHGVKWATGEVFDQSWDKGPIPFQIGEGAVIQGWDEGLVGQRIGSRVLLVVPPDKGYGAVADHELAKETLVFAVDILGAY